MDPNRRPAPQASAERATPQLLALLLALVASMGLVFAVAAEALAAPTVARDDSYTLKEDNTLLVSRPGVLKNDSDRDGALKANFLQKPDHGSVRFQESGSVTYKPNPNYHGTDSAKYRACEIKRGNNCDTATVRFTIPPVNDGPDALDDSYSTDEDTTLSVATPGVLGNDKDVDGDTLTATITSAPLHGTAILGPDGALEYEPAPDYNGPDQITYKVDDGAGASDMARVDITVGPMNDAPIARSDKYFTKRSHNRNIPGRGILKNDTDPDGDGTLMVDSCGSNKHVRFTCYRSGRLSMRPDNGFTGKVTVPYTIVDSDGLTDRSTIELVVYKPKR